MRSVSVNTRSLLARALGTALVALVPMAAHAQPAKGAAPIALQLPKCNVQVSGFNTGTDVVKVMSVRIIETARTSALPSTGLGLEFPVGGVKRQKGYSRLDACDAGEVEVTLERQSSPAKTIIHKVPLTPTRTSVELGDVKLLF